MDGARSETKTTILSFRPASTNDKKPVDGNTSRNKAYVTSMSWAIYVYPMK